MLKKSALALALASCSIAPAIAQTHGHHAEPTRALAMRSVDRLTAATGDLVESKPEFATLLCLGALFVGSAALFSNRKAAL